MYTVNAQEAPTTTVETEGAESTKIQWLLAPADSAPNFALRRFIVGPGGHTPRHAHDWEHEVYILRGEGVVVTDQGELVVGADQAILIAPNETHQFRCTGPDSLEMLCIVPNGPATAGH